MVVTFIGYLGESQAADLQGVDEKLLFCNVLLSHSIHGTGIFTYIWLICMVNDADDEDDDDDDNDDEDEDQGLTVVSRRKKSSIQGGTLQSGQRELLLLVIDAAAGNG